jgi:hypothetical protein
MHSGYLVRDRYCADGLLGGASTMPRIRSHCRRFGVEGRRSPLLRKLGILRRASSYFVKGVYFCGHIGGLGRSDLQEDLVRAP